MGLVFSVYKKKKVGKLARSWVKREKGFGKKRSLEKGGYGESFEEQKNFSFESGFQSDCLSIGVTLNFSFEKREGLLIISGHMFFYLFFILSYCFKLRRHYHAFCSC